MAAQLHEIRDLAVGARARRVERVPGLVLLHDAVREGTSDETDFGLGVRVVVDGAVGFTVAFHVLSFADQSVVQPALRKRIAARLKKEGIAINTPRVGVLKHDGV